MNIKWNTEKRKLGDLKFYSGNPRKGTKKEYEDLEKSLENFNIAEPLVINTDNSVIGGNFRLRILKDKYNDDYEVDVRVPDRTLSKEEADELNLRLNKNQGEWDWDLLANFNEDLLKNVGFESEELDKIFKIEVEDDNFDVLEEYEKIIEPKTKLGDLYQLGEHRLLCGDATKEEDMNKLIGKEKMKLVFTSPPYNMAGGLYENYKDNLKSEEFIKLHLDTINNLKKYLSGFIFWNVSYNKNARWEFLEIMYKIVKESGLKFLELIVWDKGHALPITSKEGLTRQYEDILLVGDEESISKDLEFYFLGKNKGGVYFNKKNQKGITNYWKIGTNRTQIKGHLACFPVALPKKGIELMTERGDNVLDPFGGSGSTLIACEQLNRRCYMMEIDPKYCDIIIQRWEQFTGQKAKKIN